MLNSLQKLFPLHTLFPILAPDDRLEFENEDYSSIELKEMCFSFILLLGLGMILSSIVFFFAYNWQIIPHFIKFGSIQFLFCISIFSTYKLGLDTIGGKLSLCAASLFVGMFLAVFGQVYQSNADSYLLFLTWSIAIFPFVLISKFSPLWVFLILLINLTLYLFIGEHYKHIENVEQIITVLLISINAFLLFLREMLVEKIAFISQIYTRRILYAILQSAISIELILSMLNNSFYLLNLSTLISLIFSLLLYLVYRFIYLDLFIIANTLLASASTLIIYIAMHIDFSLIPMLIFSFVTIALYSFLGIYLEYLRNNVGKEIYANDAHYQLLDSIKDKVRIKFQKPSKDMLNVIAWLKGKLEQRKVEKQRANDKSNYNIKKGNLLDRYREIPSHIKLITQIGACISVLVLGALFFLIYELFFINTPFFLFVGTGLVLLSLYIHRQIKEQNTKHSFFKLYQGMTLLLLAYLFINIGLIEYYKLPLWIVTIIIGVLSQILYPFLHYAGSRFVISLYTLVLIHISIYDDSSLLMLLACAYLFILSLGYTFEKKIPFIKPFLQAMFISFSTKIITLLLGFFEFEKNLLSYEKIFSLILALWLCILYCFYAKKQIGTWKKLFQIIKVKYIFILASLVAFVFFEAYAFLFLVGMLLLAIYSQRVELLRQSILFSLIIIPIYYYSLELDFLTKSFVLFLSGLLLLLTCFYNKEVYKHA